MRNSWLVVCVALSLAIGLCGLAAVHGAGLTSAHRKDLNDIRRDMGRVPTLIRQKKADEADKLLAEAETKIKEIVKESGLKEDDKAISSVQQLIDTQKKAMLKHKIDAGEIQAVSFVKEVAPILEAKCVSCHGADNPRKRLRLDSFAGMKKGGMGGPLLTIGDPDKSLIVTRIKSTGNDRMPQGDRPLPAKEIETISTWILQGAKYDSKDENALLATLVEGNRAAKPKEKITIAKATGNETVSFTKDIAPFMVNLCVRCHSGNNPRSGFSLETFEKLMQGGDSGRVVIPGNIDGSRMWDLVGKQDPIKMPPGQLLITRTNWNNLRTWIEEGAKFDGNDATVPLRQLVPTEEEAKAAELAKLSHDELAKKHLERGQEIWKLALTKETPKVVESKEFIVMGNGTESRLEQVNKWAEENAKELRTLFSDKAEHLWKGKLTIFVMKDRFSYEEFTQVVNRREPPREVTGHSVVTQSWEDVYVCLQDVGDGVTSESGGLQLNLTDHMTGAYLQRSAGKVPNWVLRGTGLAVGARKDPNNEFIKQLRQEVPGLLKTLEKPEDVFSDGQFSPASIGPVGYTVVDFLLKGGGGPKFGQFVKSVQGGTAVPQALQTVYGSDAKTLGQQYGSAVTTPGKKK